MKATLCHANLDLDVTTDSTGYEPGEPMRYVFIERPRCPACDSTELKTTHSDGQGDGSVCRTTKCKTCNHNFFVIVE